MYKILGFLITMPLLSGCAALYGNGGNFAKYYEGKNVTEIKAAENYIPCSYQELAVHTLNAEQFNDIKKLRTGAYRQGYILIGQSHGEGTSNAFTKNDVTGLALKLSACLAYWGSSGFSYAENQTRTYYEQVVDGIYYDNNGQPQYAMRNEERYEQVNVNYYNFHSYYFIKLDLNKSFGAFYQELSAEQKKIVGLNYGVFIRAVANGSQAEKEFNLRENDILLEYNGQQCTIDNSPDFCGVNVPVHTARVYREGKIMNIDVRALPVKGGAA
ncbi:hypothetical protein Z042_06510 [Chania multitudinisentens RB-25]|uniref:PDZ domain-containing protein n=1 Tax=Chania multitudinisentens RB-25 TaxID=1441930 RepID=W0LJR6_9GAMM|nr:hypothetical protein [Chania multitudinisentens]AHG22679.1 hypothetical protein Z042_06510 [Chania multitudinisentens RB-25]